MLKMRKLSDSYDLKVFTDSGDYFGDIEECILAGNKISGWRYKRTSWNMGESKRQDKHVWTSKEIY